MRLTEKYQEVSEITKGTTYESFFNILHLLATCSYLSFAQLNAYNPKICTDKGRLHKLTTLVELGYMNRQDGIYIPTEKTIKVLADEGYNVDILPALPTGQGNAHSLAVSEAIIKAMKEPFFHAIIRPYFKYLIPDFAVVYKNGDKAKLVFVEVEETDKPDSYLEEKRVKYNQLARDPQAYKTWKYWAEKLGLRVCSESEFCFSIKCYGDTKEGWGRWQSIK